MTEFDRYAHTYEEAIADSIGFCGHDHSFFLEAKAVRLVEIVRRRLGDPGRVRVLDVGCGTGALDAHLAGRVGALEGVDASAEMVDEARRRNEGVTYHVGDARSVPAADAAFDLAFVSNVLHHVPPGERDAVLSELRRVTRPGGLVVVIEHNPLNPLTRLAVSRCAFDEDAVLLTRGEARRRVHAAGLRVVESRYFLFLPWAGRLVAGVERALARLPLGAQYYVAAHV